MVPPALHPTSLPRFAQPWPSDVERIVLRALEEETKPTEVRAVVLALTADRTACAVSLETEWSTAPMVSNLRPPAGFISMTPWLDRLDAVARAELSLTAPSGFVPPQSFRFENAARDACARAAWLELYRALAATATDLATKHLSKQFKHPVGVFIAIPSDGDPTTQAAVLVAMCHERGAPLWPVREHRTEHGYASAYPFASLINDALTVFYPEGVGPSGAEGPPAIRQWRLSEVETAHIADERVVIRFRGEPTAIDFSAGATREELGGPSAEAVHLALSRWVGASGKVDFEGDTRLPLSADALLVAFSERQALGGGWLRQLVEAQGFGPVAALAGALSVSAERASALHAALFTVAVETELWAEALQQYDSMSKLDQKAHGAPRLKALASLGDWPRLLEASSEPGGVADEKQQTTASWQALALVGLGRLAEARAVLPKLEQRERFGLAALVEAADDSPQADAAKLLGYALSNGASPAVMARAKKYPPLAGVIAQHEKRQAAIETSRIQLETTTISGFDVSKCQTLKVPAASKVFVAHEPEGTTRVQPALVTHREGVWFGASAQGELIRLKAGESEVVLHTFAEDERICAVVAIAAGVVVSTGRSVYLIDFNGGVRAELSTLLEGEGPIAAYGAVVAFANAGVLSLARVSGASVTWLSSVGLPGETAIVSLGFVSASRIVVVTHDDSLVLDVADPTRPRFTSRLNRFSLLGTREGRALVQTGDQVLLLEVISSVRALWRIENLAGACAVTSSDGRTAVAGGGALVLVENDLRVERYALLTETGAPFSGTFITLNQTDALAVNHRGAVALLPAAFDVKAIFARTELSLSAARAALTTQLEAWLAEGIGTGPLGFLAAAWREPQTLVMWGHQPCSVASFRTNTAVEVQLKVTDAAPAHSPIDEKTLAAAIETLREAYASGVREQLLVVMLSTLLKTHGPRARVNEATFAVLDEQRTLRIVDVVRAAGDLGPLRAVIVPRALKTARQQLAEPNWQQTLGGLIARARREEAFRSEVLSLLAHENIDAADAVAREIVDLDLEGAAQAWLSAARRDVKFALPGLLLAAQRGHAEVRETLQGLGDHALPDVALKARHATGRFNEDATVAVVRRVLLSLTQPGDVHMVPLEALAALSLDRLQMLKSDLLAASERLEVASALWLPLLRVGWALDPKTLREGNARRAGEVERGLESLEFDDDADASATAARFVIAQRVIENLKTSDAAVWPAEFDLERGAVGWQRFFDVAWPHWQQAHALEMLHEILPGKARPVAADMGPDARFALQLLTQDVLRGEARFAEVLGRALAVLPFGEKTHAEVVAAARAPRIRYGWSLLRQRRFAEARQVANAALADAPADGQALFFDARLSWLEQNDPREAMRRVDAALGKAVDGSARAKLINLYGVAHDALGESAEALGAFKTALKVSEATDDNELTQAILSNIAEAHWRLGQRREARAYAEQAARRGPQSDIVKHILSQGL